MSTPEAKPPSGYWLIPRKLAIILTILAAYVAIALTVLAVGVWTGLGKDSSQEDRITRIVAANQARGLRTEQALCALRSDVERRIQASSDFLAVHPEGLPGLISPAELRKSQADQQRTVVALSGLKCE